MRNKSEIREDSSHISHAAPDDEKGDASRKCGFDGSGTKLLLRVSEAAAILGIGVGTLYHWVSEGRVPHVKLSLRCLRFRRSDLEQWILENAKDVISHDRRSQ